MVGFSLGSACGPSPRSPSADALTMGFTVVRVPGADAGPAGGPRRRESEERPGGS